MDFDGKNCYILRSLFEFTGSDGALQRVLKYATHAYTEPQRIITALHAPSNDPHELETLEWLPNPDREIKIKNYNFVSREEADLLGYSTPGQREVVVETSFDAMAFAEFSQTVPGVSAFPRVPFAREVAESVF